MNVGLFTDGLAHLSLSEALDWLERVIPAIRDLEIGTGGYSPAPHYDAELGFATELGRRGFRIAALNVSGNPLENKGHDAALRQTIDVAAELGVDRVVCMSGGRAELSGGAWFPDIENAVERYWQERVLPYWAEIDALAARHPGMRLCFELEPGAAVYNTSTFERVAGLGSNLCVNLDPSHFFWQSIDPLTVIAHLGDRVGYAHGKDTVIHAGGLELDGALDRTAWRYATVGDAHDASWWRSFVGALQVAGYDRVVSIEYEDDHVPAEESILRAALVLEGAAA
jgi:sugar phosphate isomerase/epimerase